MIKATSDNNMHWRKRIITHTRSDKNIPYKKLAVGYPIHHWALSCPSADIENSIKRLERDAFDVYYCRVENKPHGVEQFHFNNGGTPLSTIYNLLKQRHASVDATKIAKMLYDNLERLPKHATGQEYGCDMVPITVPPENQNLDMVQTNDVQNACPNPTVVKPEVSVTTQEEMVHEDKKPEPCTECTTNRCKTTLLRKALNTAVKQNIMLSKKLQSLCDRAKSKNDDSLARVILKA